MVAEQSAPHRWGHAKMGSGLALPHFARSLICAIGHDFAATAEIASALQCGAARPDPEFVIPNLLYRPECKA